MRWLFKSLIFAALLGVVAAPARASELPTDFEARYDFYRNGKLIGEARFSLRTQDGRWTLRSRSKGTKGLAWMLGFNERSTSSGTWVDGRPRPDDFEQRIDTRVKDIRFRADFDWAAGTVTTHHEEGQSTLALSPGVIDLSTTGLAIRHGLLSGEREWLLDVVDEDEIQQDHYRALPPRSLNTALGCLEVVTVEKIRAPESTRYTRTSHAAQLNFVPVFVEHGKSDGDRMETRIVALTVNGQEIQPTAGCP